MPEMIRYVVEGSKWGDFPFDMLRRDSAQPASADDITLMERLKSFGGDKDGLPKRVRVSLMTAERHGPLVERWESFGWKVVECSDPTVRLSEHERGKRPCSRSDPDVVKRAAQHDADEISTRIAAGGYRANLSDTERLRNHVRALLKLLERADV